MGDGLHAMRRDICCLIDHREHEPRVPCMQHLVRLGVVDVVKTPSRIVLEFIPNSVDGLRAQESGFKKRDSRDAPRDEAFTLKNIEPL